MFTLPGKLWREYSVQGNRHFYYQRHKAEFSSVKVPCSVPAEKESEKSHTLQRLSPWLLLVKPIPQPFLSLPALRAFSLHLGLPCRCKKICALFFQVNILLFNWIFAHLGSIRELRGHFLQACLYSEQHKAIFNAWRLRSYLTEGPLITNILLCQVLNWETYSFINEH